MVKSVVVNEERREEQEELRRSVVLDHEQHKIMQGMIGEIPKETTVEGFIKAINAG